MISVNALIKVLKKNKSDFFTGVPDSVLKELSSKLEFKDKKTYNCNKRRLCCCFRYRTLSFNKENTSDIYAKFRLIKRIESFDFNCS